MKTNLRARILVLAAGIASVATASGCGSGVALNPGGGAGNGGAGNGGGSILPNSAAGGTTSAPATPVSLVDCPCAPGGSLDVLACGPPWPASGSRGVPDAVVTPDGTAVAMTRCAKNAAGDCGPALYRWTAAAGTTKLADEAWVFALSDDGKTVLAERNPNGDARLALWWADTTMDLPLPFGAAVAHLLSADGTIVVSQASTSAGDKQAARWTNTEGLIGLGDLAGGALFSEPLAMTADGSFVAGYGNTAAGQEPFLWTASTGKMIDLLPGKSPPGIQTVATAMSADGKTVAGTRFLPDSTPTTIFRWTAAGGMVTLADVFSGLPTDLYFFGWTPGLRVSADGSVVAGTMPVSPTSDPRSPMAFRWTQATGTVALTPGQPSIVRAASADGRRVLGSRVQHMTGGLPFSVLHTPFLWDETHGARELSGLLVQGGANLAGVVLGEPVALSADGTTVVGHATCGSAEIMFRMTLPH